MNNSQNYIILGILSFILFIIGAVTVTPFLFSISAIFVIIFLNLYSISKIMEKDKDE